MNTIPNETENTKLYNLFLAIYFNDVSKVIDFKNSYPDLYAMKNNFQIEGDEKRHTFDLINLTVFNQIIWFEDCWRSEIMPFIKRRRLQTEQMLDYWRTEIGKQDIQRTIEYNRYWDCFRCNDPNEPDCKEEVSCFLEKGFREIDLNLYNRAECLDFAEVKKLLELGANPNIDFYEDESSSVFSHVGDRCSYLVSCEVIPDFRIYEEKGFYPYSGKGNIEQLFGDLIGLAAHKEMYNLLKTYSKEE